MEPRIIRSEERDHGATKTTTILDDEGWPFSVAKVRKTGNAVRTGYDPCDTVSYVLEGEGDCVIDGEKRHLRKGDCVAYPRGTRYKHLQGLTLLAISLPRFDRAQRVYVE